MSALEAATAFVFSEEGGYVNDPDDPGGETIYGITRRDHPEAWADGRPTKEQARAIYHASYWVTAHCDDLPDPLALCQLDTAVNMGVGSAARILQRALGVTADGKIGPITLAAVNGKPIRDLVCLYTIERLIQYARIVEANPKLAKYAFSPWAQRASRARAAALRLAGG